MEIKPWPEAGFMISAPGLLRKADAMTGFWLWEQEAKKPNKSDSSASSPIAIYVVL